MLLALLVIAFVGTLALTRAYFQSCPKWGLVDVPNQRSSHLKVTPRGGGVVFLLLFFLCGVVLAGFGSFDTPVTSGLIILAVLGLAIAVLGFIDDLFELSSIVRLLAQLIIAGIAVSTIGIFDAFTLPGVEPQPVPILGYGVTLLWILGLTNVYNFMDGIDGIAAGQGIVASSGWALASYVFFGSSLFAVLNLILAAALIGFMVWNWHPAKVFMGDVGSAFLGFYFAVLPLVLLQLPEVPNRTGLLAFSAAFMVWPFIFDGFFTFCRRALRRENVLQAHRTHLYQRLTKLGWSHRRVAAIYIAWALVCGLLAGLYLYGGIKHWTLLQWLAMAFQVVSGITMVVLVTTLEQRARRLRRVFLSAPAHSSLELDYVTEVLRSDWIAPIGPNLDLFEKEFSESIGLDHACALSSGTAALQLLLRAHGIGPRDKVLVSDFTFVATVNPILHVGAEPVLLDAERDSWNVSLERIREATEAIEKEEGRPPRALVLAHIYGICSDLDPIVEYCQQKGMLFLEDAAEAVGSRYRDRHLGSIGDAAIFSFNGNKIMTTGGGGMVVSRDTEIVEKVRFLSTQARENALHYEHKEVGYNERMSNVLAALGRAQLRRLPSFLHARERHRNFYRSLIGDHPGIHFMPRPDWCTPNNWLNNIVVQADQAGFSADEVRKVMIEENIEVRPLWKPMHCQPLHQNRDTRVFGGEVGESLFANGLSLPSGSAMTDHDKERIAAVWGKVAGRRA